MRGVSSSTAFALRERITCSTGEMAELVGFLCSGAAGYLTGQAIANDGGFDAAGVGLPTFRRNTGLNLVGDETH